MTVQKTPAGFRALTDWLWPLGPGAEKKKKCEEEERLEAK